MGMCVYMSLYMNMYVCMHICMSMGLCVWCVYVCVCNFEYGYVCMYVLCMSERIHVCVLLLQSMKVRRSSFGSFLPSGLVGILNLAL